MSRFKWYRKLIGGVWYYVKYKIRPTKFIYPGFGHKWISQSVTPYEYIRKEIYR